MVSPKHLQMRRSFLTKSTGPRMQPLRADHGLTRASTREDLFFRTECAVYDGSVYRALENHVFIGRSIGRIKRPTDRNPWAFISSI